MTRISGRYEIESEIGRGGMGVVYLAEDTTIGRKVALKKLEIGAEGFEADEAVKRFRREARLTGQLHHPDIVTLFDLVDEAGDLYLVLEYYPSKSLGDLVDEEGPLSEERTRDIGSAIASALAAAHAEGVVHRDIKPENILVGQKGAKLTDFGIARIAEAGAEAGSRITKTGMYVGTVGYMAPEQIVENVATSASDVFAAGGVLYCCLTGENPFGDGPVPSILYNIVHEDVDVTGLPASEEMKSIVAAAMSRSPDARPTAEALRSALTTGSLEAGSPAVGYVAPGYVEPAYSSGGQAAYGAAGQAAYGSAGYAPADQAAYGSSGGGSVPAEVAPVGSDYSSPGYVAVPPKPKSSARKWIIATIVLLVLLVIVIAARAGNRTANVRTDGAPPGPTKPYTSKQGFAVAIPGGWNADFEPNRKVDRFYPRIGTGGVMVHALDNYRPELGSLTEGEIMDLVKVDPVGQIKLAVDEKSINIDRSGSYSGNQAIVATYELDDVSGKSRYSGKTYFFNRGDKTWAVYEVAPKGDRQNMQARFSEIQESFEVLPGERGPS